MIEIRNYSSVLSRSLGFIREHKVRLSAGLVVVLGVVFIGVSPFMNRVIWIASVTPLALGAFIPLLSSRQISDSVNGWEEEFSAGVERTRMSDKKEARYVERPLHGTGPAICRMTGPVGSDHLKAGIRFAAILCVGMVVLALLAALLGAWLFAAAFTLVMWAAASIFGGEGEEKRSDESRATSSGLDGLVAVQGHFYRGLSWFTEEMASRVDDDGIIYKGSNWISEEWIGRVDADGTIYKGTSFLNEEIVGRIDRDGVVCKGSNWFTESRAGRVADDGTVYEGKSWLDEKRVGRVDRD